MTKSKISSPARFVLYCTVQPPPIRRAEPRNSVGTATSIRARSMGEVDQICAPVGSDWRAENRGEPLAEAGDLLTSRIHDLSSPRLGIDGSFKVMSRLPRWNLSGLL
jgi:hypothetical protein